MNETKLKELLENPLFKAKIREMIAEKSPQPSPKREEKKKEIGPPVYSLEVISICSLCKSYTYRLFNMQKYDKGLISVRVSNRIDMVEPRKREFKGTLTCPNCSSALLRLSKEKLVDKLIRNRLDVVAEFGAMNKWLKEEKEDELLYGKD